MQVLRRNLKYFELRLYVIVLLDFKSAVSPLITSLTLHSKSLQGVVLADDSPHLKELKLFCVNKNIASRYLTGEAIFCCEY